MRRLLALSLLVAAAACGATTQFTLDADDNNPQQLASALAAEKKAAAQRKPTVYFVTVGSAETKKLVAWDLAASKARWEVQADVTSRVVVGADFVAAREGKDTLVARDGDDGKVRWRVKLGEKQKFLGAAADGDKTFYVVRDDTGKRTWELVALGRTGDRIWAQSANATLGGPAAKGGLVYMPFLTQWITIIDADSGKQLARILQKDETLSYVRTTSDGVFYGSKGVFLLDDNSWQGTRGGATYFTAALPGFVRPIYDFDKYHDVQAGYSAYDRNRLLWRAAPGKEGIGFTDNQTVVLSYRFFFAFDAESGQLRWAHTHPRWDVVSAEHTGKAIVYVSQNGELRALDPKKGALIELGNIGQKILGATIDAEGFAPKGDGVEPKTAQVLAAIVRDRDARFTNIKLYAVEALGTLDDPDVAPTLLALLRDEKTPKEVYAKAAEVLIARKDAEAAGVLIEALSQKADFLAGTRPRAIDVIARALGAIGAPDAAKALLPHFEDPETPLPTVQAIAQSLAQLGNRSVLPSLRAWLLMYRADPLFASDTTAPAAVIDALLSLGGSAERELVAFVASEPRTQEKVAEYARRALSAPREKGAPTGAK